MDVKVPQTREYIFLVIEPDPFIALDMIEILSDGYPGVRTVHHGDCDSAVGWLRGASAPILVVASVRSDSVQQSGIADTVVGRGGGILMLGDQHAADEDGVAVSGWTYLAKPFTTETLATAVAATLGLKAVCF